MFSDFYEKFNFKKTTPEEKKEVVENTGKYFPEDHSNKIKGMDELAKAVVNNAMKKQDEIVNRKPGYVLKHCKICGKEFESYRGVGVYCSGKCRKEGIDEAKARYDAKRTNTVYIPNKTQWQKHKAGVDRGYTSKKFVNEEVFNKAKKLRSTGMTIAEVAAEMGYSMMFMQKVLRNSTYEEFDLMRKREQERRKRNFKKLKEAPENKPITHVETVEVIEPQPQPQPQAQSQTKESLEMKYLALMQKTLSIIAVVKSTSDVKECINKVFDALNED